MTDTILIPTWVDGHLTPVEKLEAHLSGLRHKAVSIFVMNKGRILIQQRAFHKYHTPGLWANTCCTHPIWGETPIDCAKRRMNEELGITGLTFHPRGQLEYRAEVGGGMIEHEVVDVFLANARDLLAMTPNPDEVAATRWITPDNLRAEMLVAPDRFTPWLHIYMSRHSETIFGSN